MDSTCKYCGLPVSKNFYYCPTCGKNLIKPPLSTSMGKQLWLYFISFFLPPFGIWPSIKYILDKNEKAKIVGIIGLILSILSIIITFSLISSLFSSSIVGDTSQLQQLKSLGY